ncbi:MAG TPA: hypothetical protein PK020_10035 [Ilumatobacteraceae bacterium]|nr:hypothetical protein [Ilumatobacteraceae bacterium]HRB04422.1 hypothetical protein [Ilumatobacteraceae bacterium]
MFTSLTLNSEIARQRQSTLVARSNRFRAWRRPADVVPETCGSLIELPVARSNVSNADSLVA